MAWMYSYNFLDVIFSERYICDTRDPGGSQASFRDAQYRDRHLPRAAFRQRVSTMSVFVGIVLSALFSDHQLTSRIHTILGPPYSLWGYTTHRGSHIWIGGQAWVKGKSLGFVSIGSGIILLSINCRAVNMDW